jgi:LPPG:FO 2-phospho-L-lactate transferase
MIVALAGGVGGAKLADGLAKLCGPRLTVVVNTGDDFEHLGLLISPDVDTVMYTLAGIANPTTGWGIADETWSFVDQVGRLGGPTWFQLGDRDLAMHVLRTEQLRQGMRPTVICQNSCHRLGIESTVLPMTDQPVRTIVQTATGDLAFQEYFVHLKCDAAVTGFKFQGIESAEPTTEIEVALRSKLAAIFLCPSNPFVSLDPILSVPGMRQLIAGAGCPIIAVSPIIAGAAVKGPAAKMMVDLGFEASAATIARRYRDLIDGIVIDTADESLLPLIKSQGLEVHVTGTFMRSNQDRYRLASECLLFAKALREGMV